MVAVVTIGMVTVGMTTISMVDTIGITIGDQGVDRFLWQGVCCGCGLGSTWAHHE